LSRGDGAALSAGSPQGAADAADPGARREEEAGRAAGASQADGLSVAQRLGVRFEGRRATAGLLCPGRAYDRVMLWLANPSADVRPELLQLTRQHIPHHLRLPAHKVSGQERSSTGW